jgi:hypothetical protein
MPCVVGRQPQKKGNLQASSKTVGLETAAMVVAHRKIFKSMIKEQTQ